MGHSYQQFLEAAMRERGPDHPIWADNSKSSGRELGELCGLHVPEVFQGPCSLKKMTPPDHDAVIKPVEGCSSRGIRPLRHEGGGYTNLFTGEPMTWGEAVASAMADKHAPRNLKLLERGHPDAMRPPWLLEELILNEGGSLACDWKAFCFGGRVEAVFQMVRIPGEAKAKQVKWWGRGWEDLGDIAPVKTWKYTPSLEGPHDPARLIDAFERVAGLVDSPFIRVDLYEQESRVVWGEVTPHPTGGTVKLVPEWDRRFGAAWAAV